jgi:hypothetical protein
VLHLYVGMMRFWPRSSARLRQLLGASHPDAIRRPKSQDVSFLTSVVPFCSTPKILQQSLLFDFQAIRELFEKAKTHQEKVELVAIAKE